MTKANEKTGGTTNDDGDFRYFILAVNRGTAVVEKGTLSAAEIPLAVLSTLGVSTDTTDAARASTKNIAESIHGTVDSIAEQIATAVSHQVSLASDVVASMTKDGSK